MTPIARTQITNELIKLLKETFEGPEPTGPSAFLNKGCGLFQTLEGVSSEMASAQAWPEGSTIAAHTEHVRFYIDVHDKLLLGFKDKIDWEESWRVKTVSGEQWNLLRDNLRLAYTKVREDLRGVSDWGEDESSIAMAIITHTAYHLGAIRQLLLAVRPAN